MVFKLAKDELLERTQALDAAHAALAALNVAIERFNTTMEEAKKPLSAAQTAYNTTLKRIHDLAEQISLTRRAEFEEKPAKWRDSEAGQAVADWIGQWEDYASDQADPDLYLPDELDEVDDGPLTEFADLPATSE